MRLIVLAVGALTFLSLGLVSLDFQVQKTSSEVTMSGNAGIAFNTTEAVLGDVTTTLGVNTPGMFLAALVAFLAVILWAVLN